MAEMLPRQVASPAMISRQSNDATRTHTAYDEMNVEFEQDLYTYEYSSYRGEIQPRTIATVQMRGR